MGILKDFKDRASIHRDFGNLPELLEKYLTRDDHPRRVELLKMYRDGHNLTGKNGLRRLLGAFDLEFFGKAYLPHYFIRETPEFHRELDDIWTVGVLRNQIPDSQKATEYFYSINGNKRAVAAPRGHAKSTTFTFKDDLHAILYEYKHYIIILSDTSTQAEGFLEDIQIEIEDNKVIIEDFGELKGDKEWNKSALLTSTDIKIEAIGSGKKVRGRRHHNWRPDLIVLDDIENDENVANPAQRKKLSNWYFKAVSKAGDTYTDIMYIGTILDYDSLLSNILKNPGYQSKKYKAVISDAVNTELWDQWNEIYIKIENNNHQADALAFFEAHRDAMLEGTEVLWESKKSYYDLMVDKVTDGEDSFFSEYQNDPSNPEECIFKEEWLDEYKPLEVNFRTGFTFYGFLDPSLGKNNRSDYSAIITIAKQDSTGYLFVADADIERRHPDKIIEDCLEKEKWLRLTYGRGYKKFGCETNQFQWYLKENLAKASAAVNLYLPIEEVPQHSDKIGRITTMQPDVKNKYIKFDKKHKLLWEQMIRIRKDGRGGHDDGPDALEACRTLAKGSIFDSALMGIFRGVKIWR